MSRCKIGPYVVQIFLFLLLKLESGKTYTKTAGYALGSSGAVGGQEYVPKPEPSYPVTFNQVPLFPVPHIHLPPTPPHIHVPIGYKEHIPITVPSNGMKDDSPPGKQCSPSVDGCIMCSCNSTTEGYCEIRDTCDGTNFFKPYQLTPYEYDIDIVLLRNQNYNRETCTYTPIEGFTELISSFSTKDKEESCSEADAYTRNGYGEPIKLDGIEEIIVDVDPCVPEEDISDNDLCYKKLPSQCRPGRELHDEYTCEGYIGGKETCSPVSPGETGTGYQRKKRAIRGEQLNFASSTVGQSNLRSVGFNGGCPSANMCVRRNKCCALVFLQRIRRIGCPSNC